MHDHPSMQGTLPLHSCNFTFHHSQPWSVFRSTAYVAMVLFSGSAGHPPPPPLAPNPSKCLLYFTPSLTLCYPVGVELYMLPAIDMINHATEPDKRNTLLRKSSAEMTVKVDGTPLTVHGFFTMKAGKLSQRASTSSLALSLANADWTHPVSAHPQGAVHSVQCIGALMCQHLNASFSTSTLFSGPVTHQESMPSILAAEVTINTWCCQAASMQLLHFDRFSAYMGTAISEHEACRRLD